MPKLTTADVLRLALPLLSAPRRVRDMLEHLLVEKRRSEDSAKAVKVEV